ncbi:MAG: hypothetical protein GEV08_07600 [Acidimicrobiia bacterium]|nr:hypothetical protein [Acidimicrobiia bacterium]
MIHIAAGTTPFLEALRSEGPAPDRARNLELYAWLVGSWDLDVVGVDRSGAERRRAGEWHFGWVLEGRAIQDVWIVPSRGQRDGDAVANDHYYGTTLRVYDPRIDAWHIQYTDPVSQTYLVQTGRSQGQDIVQTGHNSDGAWRWSFREITPTSYFWQGERSVDAGATWETHLEFRARRADRKVLVGSP